MSHVTYTVVEHDGGWAYKVGDVFSETFATREAAHAAAARAAACKTPLHLRFRKLPMAPGMRCRTGFPTLQHFQQRDK